MSQNGVHEFKVAMDNSRPAIRMFSRKPSETELHCTIQNTKLSLTRKQHTKHGAAAAAELCMCMFVRACVCVRVVGNATSGEKHTHRRRADRQVGHRADPPELLHLAGAC